MRGLVILMALIATPALAHHEVVMVTSVLPALSGLALVVSVGVAAMWSRWRGK